jgi:hypothetical protein
MNILVSQFLPYRFRQTSVLSQVLTWQGFFGSGNAFLFRGGELRWTMQGLSSPSIWACLLGQATETNSCGV